jgi:hypothetical protein
MGCRSRGSIKCVFAICSTALTITKFRGGQKLIGGGADHSSNLADHTSISADHTTSIPSSGILCFARYNTSACRATGDRVRDATGGR